MTIWCHTCRRSFPVGEKEIVADNGSEVAVLKCPTCGVMYLAIDDGKTTVPRLLKLSQTKSFIMNTEKATPSKILKPAQQRMVVTPAEAMAEAQRRR